MEFLITLIILIAIFKAIAKEGKKNGQNRPNNPNQPVINNQQNVFNPANTYNQPKTVPAKRPMPQKSMSQKSISQKPMTSKTTSQIPNILQKAKIKNARNMDDKTLMEIEKSHQHKETRPKDKVEHSGVCHTLGKDENAIGVSESLLGNIEDLMIKGYSGNLNLERDFISEGLDMISGFTVPDTVKFDKAGEQI